MESGGRHPGILVIRHDDDARDMKPHEIVDAVDRLERSGMLDPTGLIIVLGNQYRPRRG